MTPASEYALDADQAEALAGLAVLATSDRPEFIERLQQRHGPAWVVDLFAQAMAVANSVVEKNREMAEFVAITKGKMHPNQAERINLPTILGAALGAKNAINADTSVICEGCAFRLGSVANQCVSTQADVRYVELEGDSRFLCHMNGLDESGNPTKACPGWAKFQKGGGTGKVADG